MWRTELSFPVSIENGNERTSECAQNEWLCTESLLLGVFWRHLQLRCSAVSQQNGGHAELRSKMQSVRKMGGRIEHPSVRRMDGCAQNLRLCKFFWGISSSTAPCMSFEFPIFLFPFSAPEN
jgi:hypothetical protein